MTLRTFFTPGSVQFKGWEQERQNRINYFFNDFVPFKLSQREVHEPGFVSNGCSASDCLEYAKLLMPGMEIFLSNIQTTKTYELICPARDRYILFCAVEMNIQAIDVAKQMYGDLIATTVRHHDFIIPVYTYSIQPGQLHLWQDISATSFPLEREKRTFVDLAKFIATASHLPRSKNNYDKFSWTTSADATLKRLEQNPLRDTHPDIHTEIVSLSKKLHLLDTLPAVLTPYSITRQDVLVEKDTGAITGVRNFGNACTEAFGINISNLSIWFGYHRSGLWRPYDSQAGGDYPCWRASEILTRVFWDTLWANTGPGLEKKVFEEAVGVALKVGTIQQFIWRDGIVLDEPIPTSTLQLMREVLSYLKRTGN